MRTYNQVDIPSLRSLTKNKTIRSVTHHDFITRSIFKILQKVVNSIAHISLFSRTIWVKSITIHSANTNRHTLNLNIFIFLFQQNRTSRFYFIQQILRLLILHILKLMISKSIINRRNLHKSFYKTHSNIRIFRIIV